ncbi:hypothetical protein EI94DRAFT_795456 [Lactarius quietus]|nr:hypothetical protein EI94DRAFT_795456 [Lactarius quietus]
MLLTISIAIRIFSWTLGFVHADSLCHSSTRSATTAISYAYLVPPMATAPLSLNQCTRSLSRDRGENPINATLMVRYSSPTSGRTKLRPHIQILKPKGCLKTWSSQMPMNVQNHLTFLVA